MNSNIKAAFIKSYVFSYLKIDAHKIENGSYEQMLFFLADSVKEKFIIMESFLREIKY
jgi:hypothetical protein